MCLDYCCKKKKKVFAVKRPELFVLFVITAGKVVLLFLMITVRDAKSSSCTLSKKRV